MKNQAPWEREESRIYLRDIAFLGVIVVFSVFIAEQFLLKEGATLVDRIFSYLLIFIPLGTINLVAHYYYRNRRIRLTGSLRSSLRYRLSLAFMVVSIIPSIPIFFISSNMVERLVDIFFGLDVVGAFDSADRVMDRYRRVETERFYNDLKQARPDLFQSPAMTAALGASLFAGTALNIKEDYAAFVIADNVSYESRPLLAHRLLPKFEAVGGTPEGAVEIHVDGSDYGLIRLPLAGKGEYLVLGRRISRGVESDIDKFNMVRERLRAESGWRNKVPSTLRLGLGLIYVFMICAALLIAIVIARQISNPIVSLAAATRAVSDGRLDTRLDIKASGEMGILIDSFNQMTQELVSLRANLLHSQRVAAWQEVAKRLVHEIKNPLTPIQLSADRMLRWLDHPEKGSIEKIVRGGATTIGQQVNVLKH
ncbi:MAG: HAMP domain-containing protein, partial [Spirochaetia bacterium]|nr:HAMP domain-containing protein [Spirochaetia bacterium]